MVLHDFVSLFYPELCVACGHALHRHESLICNACYVQLPQSHYHLQPNNPLERLLAGRFPYAAATSFYLFQKKSRVQQVLHALKYRNQPAVGQLTGKWFGETLKTAAHFAQVDWIVPVPLHPSRQRERGYNQSAEIARGLGEGLQRPLNENILYRRVATKTQTKKGKGDRWENVESIFALREDADISNKKILLVDDVITTGSTIEACAQALLKQKNVSISIAALAFAQQ